MSRLDVNNDNSLEEFNNHIQKECGSFGFMPTGRTLSTHDSREDLKSNNKHGVRLAKVRDDYIPRLNNIHVHYPTLAIKMVMLKKFIKESVPMMLLIISWEKK